MKKGILLAVMILSTSVTAKTVSVGLGQACDLEELGSCYLPANILCNTGLSCIPNPFPVQCNAPIPTCPKNGTLLLPRQGICARIIKEGEACCNPKLPPCLTVCAPGLHCVKESSSTEGGPSSLSSVCKWINTCPATQTEPSQKTSQGNGTIYPNPFTSGQTLCVKDENLPDVSNNPVTVTIEDMSGKIVQKTSSSSDGGCGTKELAIKTDDKLKTGTYIFQITSGNYLKTYKVIKK